MLMNLDDIIESFKNRVHDLSRHWDAINSSATHLGADEDELELLKKKLDMVQEQNAAIIIDLDHIKKISNLDNYSSQSEFTLLNTGADHLHDTYAASSVDPHRPPNTPQSENSPNRFYHRSNRAACQHHLQQHQQQHQQHQHQLTALPYQQHVNASGMDVTAYGANLENEVRLLKKQRTSSAKAYSMPVQLDAPLLRDPATGSGMLIPINDHLHAHGKDLHLSGDRPFLTENSDSPTRKDIFQCVSVVDLQEIEKFELHMTDIPKTVADLYYEYKNSLQPQIEEFEKVFGKGQLSKITKIRTYQRRRALVSEIEKYAVIHSQSIQDAIRAFETLRTSRKRSVQWLYNNLGTVLRDFKDG